MKENIEMVLLDDTNYKADFFILYKPLSGPLLLLELLIWPGWVSWNFDWNTQATKILL